MTWKAEVEDVVPKALQTPRPLNDPLVVTTESVEEDMKRKMAEAVAKQRAAFAASVFRKSWAGLYDLTRVVEFLERSGHIRGDEPKPNLYALDEYARIDLNN